MFLQLGKPAYYYNGRKKAKVALLKSDRVTCQVSKAHEHVCVSILQLCAWAGCSTEQGFVKHMFMYHSNGLYTNYCLSVFYITTFIYSHVQWKIMSWFLLPSIMVRITCLDSLHIHPLINVHHFPAHHWILQWTQKSKNGINDSRVSTKAHIMVRITPGLTQYIYIPLSMCTIFLHITHSLHSLCVSSIRHGWILQWTQKGKNGFNDSREGHVQSKY